MRSKTSAGGDAGPARAEEKERRREAR